MTRLILASLVLTISILPLYAQSSSLHTDRSGYTTGIDGSRTVNTYTDQYGNTTGSIGGKYISTYSDGYGGTRGMIGKKEHKHVPRRVRQHDRRTGLTNLHRAISGVSA